jgi:hypothetical protein
MWPRLCSAPLREGLRAALRPGHVKKFPFINIKSREFLSRIPKPRLSCRRPVHEGALHEAFLRWGGMRRLRTCLASTDSGGFGFPSGPTTGLCHWRGWTGTGERREIAVFRLRPATSPEERTRVLRRRDGTPGGVAVCLCFPAIREIRRGLLQVRLSAFRLPSSGFKGRKSVRLPSRGLRENAGAWLFEM